MIEYKDILDILKIRFGSLRLTVLKNLASITYAFLILSRGGRSGNGRISLSAIARALYGGGTQKSRFKRLSRFLNNKFFTPEAMIIYLVYLVIGSTRGGLIPVVVDQTTIGGVEVLMGGLLYFGRILPIGFSCFVYEKIYKSQNVIELGFLSLIMSAFSNGLRPVFIMDRGYGKVNLIKELNNLGGLYIIRVRKKVIVWINGKPKALSGLRYKKGKIVRYSNILYRKDDGVLLDLIIYRGTNFADTWYLVVPAGSFSIFPADEVVKLYRERMQIEQGFRDWKTHLGVRGLKLKVDRDIRLNRLLLSLSVVYIILLLLGICSFARANRKRFEVKRGKERHGTKDTMSVFTIAIAILSCVEMEEEIKKQLKNIIMALRSKSVLSIKDVLS